MPTHPPPSQTTLGSTPPETSHDTTESMTISANQNTLLLYPAYDHDKEKITVRASTFLSQSEEHTEHPTLPQISLAIAALEPALCRWEHDKSDDNAFNGNASRIRQKISTELRGLNFAFNDRAWTVDSCATKECFERLTTDCGGQEHTINTDLGPSHVLINDGPASNRQPKWDNAFGQFYFNSQSEADHLMASWPRMTSMLRSAPDPMSITDEPTHKGMLTLISQYLHERALSHLDQSRLADLRVQGQFEKAACLARECEKETMAKLDREFDTTFFSGLSISHCSQSEYLAYTKVKDRFVK